MTFLDNLTRRILNLSPLVIVLFTIMVPFHWYSETNPISITITEIVNITGIVGIFLWLYSVSYRSAKILSQQNFQMKVMKSYKYNAAFLALAYLIVFFWLAEIDPWAIASQADVDAGTPYTYNRITYPLVIIFIICLAFMYRNMLKLLSSAEAKKEQHLKDYYKTYLLLFFIPWVGVWYVHDRAKDFNE